jgi:hypothetical protein
MTGPGYTLNFAHRGAWLWMLAILAVPMFVVLMVLVVSMDFYVKVDFSDEPGIISLVSCDVLEALRRGVSYGWQALAVHRRKGASSASCSGMGVIK